MGLLDWITDGGGSLFSGDSQAPPMGGLDPSNPTVPPPQQPMAMPQQPPPAPPVQQQPPQLTGDFDQNGLGGVPSAPPQGAPPLPPQMAGAGASPNGLPGGAEPMPQGGQMPPPPVPMPQARPAGAPPPVQNAVPPPPPETPPGAPMNIAPGGAGAPPPAPPQGSGFSAPDMQNRSGLLASMGMSPDVASRMRGAVGAGFKAAGNSAGKSPFQALASGVGESMEGGKKSSDTNTDQTIKYLNAAVNAQKAGDTKAYNDNYTKYLAAKLKADTEKAASTNAKGNTPEQLYLSAARLTNTDPRLKGANDAIREARSRGDTTGLAQAQAALAQKQAEIMAEHSAKLGLDPKAAAAIGQQPGMTPGNAIDAGKQGIDEKNIAEKLHPGQYYTNPKDGKLYQYNGPGQSKSQSVKGIPEKPTAPEPRDPNKPERGSRASAAADEGED